MVPWTRDFASLCRPAERGRSPRTRWTGEELLAAASAVHSGRALTDYAADGDLHGMLGVGFGAVGTQRVWVEGMALDRV